jgi:hypothetical protein
LLSIAKCSTIFITEKGKSMFSFFKRKPVIDHAVEKERLNYLYNIVIGMARVQMIHPELIGEKSIEEQENLKYVIDIINSAKKQK